MKQQLDIEKLTNDILRTLDFYTSDQKYNHVAELLADHNSYSGIDIVRFGDNEDEIMERLIIEKISVLKMMDLCMEYFEKQYKYELVKHTTCTIVEKIPQNAFREALANALVHRYWDVSTFVQISMYKDGIKITSPGGLPYGITKAEYLNGQISVPRNPILANLFYRLRYSERFGTDIRRINRMYKDAKNKPQYHIYDSTITVYLPVYKDKVQLTDDEMYVYQYMMGSQKYSRIELEHLTGLNKDRLIRILNSLIKKEVISKSGTGRNVKYYNIEA